VWLSKTGNAPIAAPREHISVLPLPSNCWDPPVFGVPIQPLMSNAPPETPHPENRTLTPSFLLDTFVGLGLKPEYVPDLSIPAKIKAYILKLLYIR